MGAAAFAADLERVARDASAPPVDRARAVLELQRHGPAPEAALLRALQADRDAGVRAAVVYVAGVQSSSEAKAIAAGALKDVNPMVQRRAAEALVRQGLTPEQPAFAPIADIYALLGSPDRFVRYAGRLALEHTARAQWAPRVLAEGDVTAATEGLLALSNTATVEADLAPVFERLLVFMRQEDLTPGQKIRVLRTFQVAATETANGVSADIRRQVHDALIGQFPQRESASPADTYVACASRWPGTSPDGCDQTLLAHHMAKVLAYTGEPDVIDRVLAVMPKGDVDQPGQIDYMYALREIDSGWSSAQKDQVMAWFGTSSKWRGGSTFAGHLNTIFDATLDAFTDEEKARAYAAAPLFAPLTPEEVATAGSGRRGRGAGAAANAPAGAAPGAAGPAGPRAGGAGGRGGPVLPATARQVPLDRQERYDNLVFPRGGGPGSLAGRGGAPSALAGAQTFRDACAVCHRFGSVGNDYAPDLTNIGRSTPRRDILRSVFFPDERVADRYLTTVLAMADGRSIRGLLVSETPQVLSLKTAEDPQPITVQVSQVRTRTTERNSIMPDDLPDRVGDQNLANVVAYLMGQ
jgi:putative heme-binding domain-containing protein